MYQLPNSLTFISTDKDLLLSFHKLLGNSYFSVEPLWTLSKYKFSKTVTKDGVKATT